MKAAVVSLSWRAWLLKKPAWLDHQTAVALSFAVKTFAASLLALYIAFWAGLDDPRWSFLTVFVVSQPDSGLVLAKSFYRILGTIAGVLVTIALVFGLAQYGELFVAAVAVWMCLCNFAARAVRNSRPMASSSQATRSQSSPSRPPSSRAEPILCWWRAALRLRLVSSVRRLSVV